MRIGGGTRPGATVMDVRGDAAGNVDGSPATDSWKVKKKR